MRILQVIAGAEYGGAEEFFIRLCQALQFRGVDQRVLLRPHPDRESLLSGQGIPLLTTAFGGVFDWRSGQRFQHEIEHFSPDIVLTWMSRATRFCPAKNSSRSFVHVGRLGGYYDLRYYRHCDHLIGNTSDIIAYLTSQGWPKERAHYLPNFVSSSTSKPITRAELGFPEDRPLLLSMGRLHPNKAFDVLLKALTQIPDAVLCIAGSGELDSYLRSLAITLGINRRVRFLGWRSDVASLFAAADIYVCPSRIEPLGNVIIEAWAQGVPVVASSAIGPRTLIDDGQTGLLFLVDDPDSLAVQVRKCLDDMASAKGMARSGKAEFEKRFSASIVVDQYLNLFQNLMVQRDTA